PGKRRELLSDETLQARGLPQRRRLHRGRPGRGGAGSVARAAREGLSSRIGSGENRMIPLADAAQSPLRTNDPVILVVDDEPAVLSALRRCFRHEFYEVI